MAENEKKKMSSRCKIDTSREVRQWIGTFTTLGYTLIKAIEVLPGAKPIGGIKHFILRR